MLVLTSVLGSHLWDGNFMISTKATNMRLYMYYTLAFVAVAVHNLFKILSPKFVDSNFVLYIVWLPIKFLKPL